MGIARDVMALMSHSPLGTPREKKPDNSCLTHLAKVQVLILQESRIFFFLAFVQHDFVSSTS